MTTDNRTNEPTEEQVKIAHRAYYEADPQGGYWQAMRAALVAAASVAPVLPSSTVDEGKIAEVIAQANYDWSKQRLEFWRRPSSVEPPGDLDQFIARAVVEAIGGEER